ncbi:TOBE domain-containing protein [Sagittula sp. S175]|uniref:TOBE domain-containing protein n=1 Tax=Sagittula sp. S175 TaxID=3415129 RepID=UPI003C7C1803
MPEPENRAAEEALQKMADDQARKPQPNALGMKLHDKVLAPIVGKWIDEPKALPLPDSTARNGTIGAAPDPAPKPAQPQPASDIPDGGLEIHWHEGQPVLIAANGPESMAGRNVVLSLRPEKISIHKDKPTAANVLKGRVIDIAYLGNMSTYHVQMADGTMVKAQAANTRRIANRGITWEDEVWLSFTATAGVVLEDDA